MDWNNRLRLFPVQLYYILEISIRPEPVNKRESRGFASAHPIWLALLKDFRTLDWAEEYKYPTVILSQMKELLAEQQAG